jgi:outer membrane receptor protein involved in Fe transport
VQSAGQEQVAIYFDEVPAPGIQSSSGDSGSQALGPEAGESRRIEVLKGPQGTTFGANSQTGVVRFIAKKPQLDKIEGQVKLGAQSLQHGDPGANVTGMFNMPLDHGQACAARDRLLRQDGRIHRQRPSAERRHSTGREPPGSRDPALAYRPAGTGTPDTMLWLQKRRSGWRERVSPVRTRFM